MHETNKSEPIDLTSPVVQRALRIRALMKANGTYKELTEEEEKRRPRPLPCNKIFVPENQEDLD